MPDIRFRGRSRRPPLDPVNALLSFLYTLLTHDCRSAAESVGLDPAVGFLHRDRPGRPSLALDLMEELRPCFGRPARAGAAQPPADRACKDFVTQDNGAVLLDRRRPQDGAYRLAGAQADGAAASLSRRNRAARARALPAGAIARAASAWRSRRLSAMVLEMRGRDAGAGDLRREHDQGQWREAACGASPRPAAISASACNTRSSRSRSIRPNGRR